MNTPTQNPAPVQKDPNEGLRQKQVRETEQKHNRDIGHMLKGGAFRAHMPKHTMPHVRGR